VGAASQARVGGQLGEAATTAVGRWLGRETERLNVVLQACTARWLKSAWLNSQLLSAKEHQAVSRGGLLTVAHDVVWG
jgi:hypothetical protein